MDDELVSIAHELLDARDNAREIVAPSMRILDKGGTFTLEEAYQVAAYLDNALIGRGYRRIGRKLGFTNRTIWPRFGIREPIWAPLYEQSVKIAQGSRVDHSLEKAVGPLIEVEVVVCLRDVPPANADELEFVDLLEWVAIGYEIVQCHYRNWEFSGPDAVADFGLHRALLVGEPFEPSSRDRESLSGELAALGVELFKDGESVARGRGEDVLGGPVSTLAWLSAALKRQPDSPPLQAGDIVTTGTLTGALPVTAGERWSMQLAGLPLSPVDLSLQD